MNWWIEQGISGFRLDVIDLIGKEIDKEITGNGPRLHPLLKEMNQATFGQHDLLTVGETWGATPEIAKMYSNPAREELSMVFQFEHITLTWKDGDKWTPIELDLPEFKKVLTKWQVELADEGWNSLFWNNHDLPRVVSKYGNDDQYRIESAKMLATTLHFMKGTPYIYQGEEIGMTNVKFDHIEDYQDIETRNFYQVRTESGVSPETMMAAIHENSRDNARTPMQWNNQEHGGFSQVTPWLASNPNSEYINVEQALNDSDSIFYHYQKLIQLRKELPIIVQGGFEALYEEDEKVFSYIRTFNEQKLWVVSNFVGEKVTIDVPDWLQGANQQCLISNYPKRTEISQTLTLEPYESFSILL